MKKITLFLIFFLAFFLRIYNVNWDNNFHLHPDERFLTMVGLSEKIPQNISGYLNPKISTMNPANLGYNFFVYGTFPLSLNKIVAVVFGNDSYNSFTLQGRMISAFFDILLLVFIYKLIRLLESKYKLRPSIKYWAMFLYALSVLPIQLSHFFTVDTFLNLFIFASFYYSINFYYERRYGDLILSAICFGLAISCKINAVFILPLNFLIILLSTLSAKKKLATKKTCKYIAVYLILSYLVVRVADPYLFENTNLLIPNINHNFIQSINMLKSFSGNDIWYPPGIQWINRIPVLFSLVNLAFFGIGMPYFIFLLLGVYQAFRKKKKEILFILLWIILFFIYQSTQFVKTMRYFIFIYPFLSMFSAFGIDYFVNKYKHKRIITLTIVVLISVWPLSFFSIYLKPQTRVVASNWIYANIPNNATILGEYWDDPLPLQMRTDKFFQIESMPVFDQDTETKWQKMSSYFEKADYYVLSSNRGWGSIMKLPQKYPIMSKFYKNLLEGKTPYKKVMEFTSYPSLNYLGIPISINDDWAEEAFTVYDHPKVMIFKKNL